MPLFCEHELDFRKIRSWENVIISITTGICAVSIVPLNVPFRHVLAARLHFNSIQVTIKTNLFQNVTTSPDLRAPSLLPQVCRREPRTTYRSRRS